MSVFIKWDRDRRLQAYPCFCVQESVEAQNKVLGFVLRCQGTKLLFRQTDFQPVDLNLHRDDAFGGDIDASISGVRNFFILDFGDFHTIDFKDEGSSFADHGINVFLFCAKADGFDSAGGKFLVAVFIIAHDAVIAAAGGNEFIPAVIGIAADGAYVVGVDAFVFDFKVDTHIIIEMRFIDVIQVEVRAVDFKTQCAAALFDGIGGRIFIIVLFHIFIYPIGVFIKPVGVSGFAIKFIDEELWRVADGGRCRCLHFLCWLFDSWLFCEPGPECCTSAWGASNGHWRVWQGLRCCPCRG